MPFAGKQTILLVIIYLQFFVENPLTNENKMNIIYIVPTVGTIIAEVKYNESIKKI